MRARHDTEYLFNVGSGLALSAGFVSLFGSQTDQSYGA